MIMIVGFTGIVSATRGIAKITNVTPEQPNDFFKPFIPNGTWETGIPPGFIKARKPAIDGGDTGVPIGFIKPRKPVNGDSGVPVGFIKPRKPSIITPFITPIIPNLSQPNY